MANRLRHREPARLHEVAKAVERRLADSPRRHVQDPEPRDRVARLHEGAQVGEHVLDLAALVEGDSPGQLVRYGGPAERVLYGARLRVGAVEDDEISIRPPLPAPRFQEDRDDLLPLGLLVGEHVQREWLPHGVLGPELLLLPPGVVTDHAVRRAQDRLGRAVVLGEAEHGRLRISLLEREDVLDARPPPAVDRLVVVPHDREISVHVAEALDQLELNRVRILVFVHQHVAEALRVHTMSALVQIEEPDRVEEKVVEVHRRPVSKRLRVARVDRGQAPVDWSARLGLERLGRDAFVFQTRDPRSRCGGRERAVLAARLAQQLPEERPLVVGIVDDEPTRVAERFGVAPEDADAGRVEGAEPDAEVFSSKQRFHSRPHLARRLVREREGEDRPLGHPSLPDQVRNPPRQDPGLAAPRAREDEQRAAGMFHGLPLNRVQIHGDLSTPDGP